ncbi:GNAT family N-acetyltransferase [Streptomyces sudanensis]|uniref:GNAT family N-acetyltransferase n=2 Tax=Streptomyces TaxID=1883 RepID=A0ABY4T7F8_9ACTN|nr:GNAT family N-acetyltransferase [Streptomyces sudanensis]MCP9957216.1 GNAT family N-acetyltransferase [Streptomyces sudanensis]MCP9986370.1 GNAT family N-acetyltransferase [Streptomyces sudanensis]MCQ0002222.1 GNAT family N-acetyltransferase [Streptomyces sudanensis]URN14907.1 GNAT family N-acetyltransferase [Streptomyces sudanensis]
MLKGMHTGIREATAADWPAIWPFFHQIVAAGDTFTFPTDLDAEEGRGWWLLEPPSRTVVAVDEAGTVVGTAKMNRNQAGNGSHVASASYMVDPAHGGRGIGRALVEYSLRWAKEAGFRGMQFNAVAQTNTHAVRLYEDLGFRIVGTVPDAFRHPTRGYTGLHVMYRPL